MCLGTELKCPVCGKDIKQKTKGRTREYCSDTCKDFNKFKNALERTILKIDFNGQHAKLARGDLFRLSNLVKLDKRV